MLEFMESFASCECFECSTRSCTFKYRLSIRRRDDFRGIHRHLHRASFDKLLKKGEFPIPSLYLVDLQTPAAHIALYPHTHIPSCSALTNKVSSIGQMRRVPGFPSQWFRLAFGLVPIPSRQPITWSK